MAKVRLIGNVKRYKVPEGESVIGRVLEGSVADIQIGRELGYETISRFHSRIYNYDEVVEVEDCSSRRGTYINGEQIPPGKKISLREGDTLTFGELTLDVSIERDFLKGLLGF